VLGETLKTSGVTDSPTCTTTATPSSPVGTYPITCTAGTLSSVNYGFKLVAGSLSVKTEVLAWSNVEYRTVNGVRLTSGIRAPSATPNAPVAILVHGGEWVGGSPTNMTDTSSVLVARGWVTMSVAYRMACTAVTNPLCGYHWPAPDEDVQAAVDWAHANIAAYGGDPNRIVLIGSSAGAQIVLDLAVHGHGIRAVGAWSPPTGFDGCAGGKICGKMATYIGCDWTVCPQTWHDATARNYVTGATVPCVVMNSTREVVPLWMPQQFVDALNANGVPNEFDILPGTGHAKAFQFALLPDGRTVLDHTASFLAAFAS
jgi:acetyl esterase/lipase